MRFWIVLLLAGLVSSANAQTTVSGKVKDNKGRPVAGASISLKDTYDGSTSDSLGNYRFKTSEKGSQVLLATSIGYKLQEQAIAISGSAVQVDFALREEPNELTAVVVSAGTFEASDSKRTTVLNPIDIVTTASANADVTGAIRTLPGAQQVGESEGLFIRGGTAQESKIFIDGTLVNNFFFSSIPDLAQRGRFSPFIFKGTVFSSGGYSALYGQALSSVVLLESVDFPDRSSASLGFSTVGINGGYQELSKKKNASWGVSYAYSNLAIYFKLIKQQPDFFKKPQGHNADANFRIKTSKTGILKFYGYFNWSDVGLRRMDIDSALLKNAFSIRNVNLYTNLSWREKLGKHWKMNLGLSYGNNNDDITQELQDQSNVKQTFNQDPFASKSFDLVSKQNLATIKAVFERRLAGLSTFRFGAEHLAGVDKTDFTNQYITNGITRLNDKLTAGFAEADVYVTNDLAAKIGTRVEHSSVIDKTNIAPRISLAYKVGDRGQFSAAYGIFYQKPDRQILMFERELQYSKATHYILNYQKVSRNYTLRAEVFYKKYQNLIKTLPDTSNAGYGNASGFEVFWRDRKTFKNVDYWISYSYLDTKRDFMNFPSAMTPNFASKHTTSLVVKKFVTKVKTQFNASYTFATGRPYYNIRVDQSNKPAIYDKGRTIPYQSLSFSVNYLPNLGKTNASQFTVIVFSVTNVLNSRQVFGYNYSYNGAIKEPIVPSARQFFFLGCFLSFGVDRSEDVINSNL